MRKVGRKTTRFIFRRIRQRTSGTTLVEVVVSLALLAVLMVAVTAAVSPFLRVYTKVINTSRAHSLANMLFETISSELSFATGNSDGKLEIGADGHAFSYGNSGGSPIVMYEKDGRLMLYYETIYEDDEKTSILQPAVYWEYTEDVYMNNVLDEVTFELVDVEGVPVNQVDVTLELHNTITGYRYERTKRIECYNMEAVDMLLTDDVLIPD